MPAVVVVVFDGVSGVLLRSFEIATPEPLCDVPLAFAGRRLVVRMPDAW